MLVIGKIGCGLHRVIAILFKCYSKIQNCCHFLKHNPTVPSHSAPCGDSSKCQGIIKYFLEN